MCLSKNAKFSSSRFLYCFEFFFCFIYLYVIFVETFFLSLFLASKFLFTFFIYLYDYDEIRGDFSLYFSLFSHLVDIVLSIRCTSRFTALIQLFHLILPHNVHNVYSFITRLFSCASQTHSHERTLKLLCVIYFKLEKK